MTVAPISTPIRVILAKTLMVKAEGGPITEDGQRRRTPRSVFLYLERGGISKEERKRLWPQGLRKGAKQQQTANPSP